jgi:hypothetical protein
VTDFYAKHWILTAPAGVMSSGPLVVTDLESCDGLIEKGWDVAGPYMSAERVRDEVIEHGLGYERSRSRTNIFSAAALLESMYGLDLYDFDVDPAKAAIPTPYEAAMEKERER